MKTIKTINILAIILFFAQSIIAQSPYYYYYEGKKQYLTVDTTKLNITVSGEVSLIQPYFKSLNLHKNIASGELKQGKIFTKAVNEIRQIPNVIAVNPNYITPYNDTIGISSNFLVELKQAADYQLLVNLATQKNVVIVGQEPYMPLWYLLSCTKNTSDNTMNTANWFYETGLFAAVELDFLNNCKDDNVQLNNLLSDEPPCVNDSNFIDQWALRNIGQYNTGATIDTVDINACPAWNITKGAGVKIAVVDKGVDMETIDLIPNLYPIMYDAVYMQSGNIFSGQFNNRKGEHGTEICGIIGSVANNNWKIAGVAPESKLMIAYTDNDGLSKSRGINWAWRNGADVINCSWNSSTNTSTLTKQAIDSALIYGRNGKGCVVVCSSGNSGDDNYPIDSVRFPANYSDVLAVGAVTWDGWKPDFSHYGRDLDVAAPGYQILTTHSWPNTDKLWADDGTSFAAPHVAGIAALILSANPNLTVHQVKRIIESTAQKTRRDAYNYVPTANRPNGDWCQEVGYGLVDAYAAVQKALAMQDLDLYIKDYPADNGAEQTTSGNLASPDIWVEDTLGAKVTALDSLTKYNIVVRVRNKSTTTVSSGFERLYLNASLLDFPLQWNKNFVKRYVTCPPSGASLTVGTDLTVNGVNWIQIPPINPLDSTDIRIPFKSANHAKLTCINNPTYKIVARIHDGISIPNEKVLKVNDNVDIYNFVYNIIPPKIQTSEISVKFAKIYNLRWK